MMATTLVPKVTCSPASGPAMSPSAPAGPASDEIALQRRRDPRQGLHEPAEGPDEANEDGRRDQEFSRVAALRLFGGRRVGEDLEIGRDVPAPQLDELPAPLEVERAAGRLGPQRRRAPRSM